MVKVIIIEVIVIILVQFSSVYLFAIENYLNRSKKKSTYLDSHGEEAQKKLAGL